MKIIITEQQYKLLTETNTNSMQHLIDMAIESMKENCENNFVDTYACEEMEAVETIKVVDVQKIHTKTHQLEEKSFLHIKIDIYYDYIREYLDFDNFVYQLTWETRQIIGNNLTISINEQYNQRKNFNW